MPFPSIFEPKTTEDLFTRINKLSPETTPLWGKMNVSQMLAHLCVSYDQIFGDQSGRPPLLMRKLLSLLIKKRLVDESPYPKNGRTAPAFVIVGDRDFDVEKARLTAYISKVEKMGTAQFSDRESFSMGKLTTLEWNNLLYKHLDHHLSQFGV
jgi:hypothetical protein